MNSLLSRLSVRNRIWMMVALLMGSILAGGLIDILTLREGQIGRTLLFMAGSGAVLLMAASLIANSITRHSLEAEVSSSTLRMRALIDAANESILLLDAQGGILAINAFGAKRFGTTPEAITGKNFYTLLPGGLAKERSELVQSVFTTGEPQHAQDQRGAVFFSNSLYPVKNAAGVVESVAVFAKDVTEQHQTREVDALFGWLDAMLLQRRMDLASIAHMACEEMLPLFDLAGAWIGRHDKSGQLAFVAGAPDNDTSDKAHPAMVLPLNLRGASWGTLHLYGRHAQQFEGETLRERLAAIATRLGYTLESAMQQEWLALLETALAGVGNSVFITDAKANIVWVNRAFSVLSGFASGEVLGKNPRIWSSGFQDAHFYQQFWHAIQTGRTWHGDIKNVRPDGSHYTVSQTVTPLRNAEGQVSHYVAILEDITQRRTEEERIKHTANYDLLTDLPNRNLFLDRLGQTLALGRRDGTSGALMFLDLDHFKEVNDQLGHAAGDKLLVTVAKRLREQVRESDTVARLGGDEFTVILPNVQDEGDAVRVASGIIEALGEPFAIAGTQAHIGVSIGIAFFPRDGHTVERVLSAADHAMYLSKGKGRNCYTFASTV